MTPLHRACGAEIKTVIAGRTAAPRPSMCEPYRTPRRRGKCGQDQARHPAHLSTGKGRAAARRPASPAIERGSVAPEAAEATLARIRAAGYPLAAIVGRIEDGDGITVA